MSNVVLPAQGWTPRWYQLPLWNYMENGGRRACIVWPRRHGKDHTCVNIMATESMKRVGEYVYVFPYLKQARRVIWNGIDRDGKRFIDAFPAELIEKKNEQEMRLHLKNGSIFQIVGGDDPDKLVGTNPVGIVYSEYALTNPMCWKLVAPILAENGGWVIFNSTPRGENHFYDLYMKVRKDPSWYSDRQTARTLRVLDPQALRELRKELNDESLFQQEAFCSFKSPLQGAYFAEELKNLTRMGRITSVSFDPSLETVTAWDLGMNDATSIWVAQLFREEIRLCAYIEGSNQGLAYYIRELDKLAALHNIRYSAHYPPHDIRVRELGTGVSRWETARSLGLTFADPGERYTGVQMDRIEAVRNILPRCWFDKEETHTGVSALKSYRRDWDDARQVFKNQPLHDWSSHGADSFGTLAMALRSRRPVPKNLPQNAITDYDPFSF